VSVPEHPHEAVLDAEYDTVERARRVERALAPEVGDIDDDRSTARLSRTDRTVELCVTAADPTALRAGLNTWTTLLSVAESADCWR
jgi:KEOPS complex subunit Pcc1